MNENKLSPKLQKIFDEYSVEFWNRLGECRECDIEETIEIFRDALVNVDKILEGRNKND